MIVYDNRTWLGSLYHMTGTVIPNILAPVFIIGVWSYVAYKAQIWAPEIFEIDAGNAHKILGTFVSFFLIFRTNQAYNRYWHSNNCLKDIQVCCREVCVQFTVYNKGGILAKDPKQKEAWEAAATQAKTDAIRYILAFCVSFKLHSRLAYDGYMVGEIDQARKEQVDMDRGRLRGLLQAQEFAVVDSMLHIDHEPRRRLTPLGFETYYRIGTDVSIRSGHILIFFMRSLALQCAVNAKEWGWLERCLNLTDGSLRKLLLAFEAMDQNITTPLPLPYCHLCKILMFIFLSVFPLVGIHADQGLYLNVIVPCIIAVAMFGIESISMEIEDPFGDDDNDFDTMRIINGIESSIFEVLSCRDDPCLNSFAWIQADPNYKDCPEFLCALTERNAILAMMPQAKPLAHAHDSLDFHQSQSGSLSPGRTATATGAADSLGSGKFRTLHQGYRLLALSSKDTVAAKKTPLADKSKPFWQAASTGLA